MWITILLSIAKNEWHSLKLLLKYLDHCEMFYFYFQEVHQPKNVKVPWKLKFVNLKEKESKYRHIFKRVKI